MGADDVLLRSLVALEGEVGMNVVEAGDAIRALLSAYGDGCSIEFGRSEGRVDVDRGGRVEEVTLTPTRHRVKVAFDRDPRFSRLKVVFPKPLSPWTITSEDPLRISLAVEAASVSLLPQLVKDCLIEHLDLRTDVR